MLKMGRTTIRCRSVTLAKTPAFKPLWPLASAQFSESRMRVISRLILRKWSAPSSARWFSVVAERETPAATQPKKKNLLSQEVAKANSQSSIADILDNWVNQGNKVKRYDIVNIANQFRNRRNFNAALQLYDWMESSNLEINTTDHAMRIDLLCKANGIASAEKYFNNLHLSEKTNKTYGALLCCYCRERAFENALDLFEEMKGSNYMSTLNYNNMLTLYSGMEQHEKVVCLVQEMEENKVAPDVYTYNLLINSYAALKNLDAIEGVLVKMKNNNVKHNLFTYGNLAIVYFNSGLREKANTFLEMMEKTKIQPGVTVLEACRIRIKFCSEINDLSGVERAWKDLKSAFPTPNNGIYLYMLSTLSKMGVQESLEKLFKEWEDGCSTYDMRLPNVLLEYYLSRNMIEEATSLYESLLNRGTAPNLRTLCLFMTLCLKNGHIDLALKYLDEGLENEKPGDSHGFPAVDTIKLFVNYFEENNDVDRAEKFIHSMKKVNHWDSNSLLVNAKASDEEI